VFELYLNTTVFNGRNLLLSMYFMTAYKKYIHLSIIECVLDVS